MKYIALAVVCAAFCLAMAHASRSATCFIPSSRSLREAFSGCQLDYDLVRNLAWAIGQHKSEEKSRAGLESLLAAAVNRVCAGPTCNMAIKQQMRCLEVSLRRASECGPWD
jgi:hypothetical protein